MDDILNRISSLLEKSGMKKIELLTKLNLKRSAWSSWTSGTSESYKKYLPQIAEIFGVSLDWLSGNEQKNKPLTDREKLIQECLDIMYSLPEDYQKAAREHLRSLAELSDKNKNK